jgi:pimeloyl-ACP methyl ester carboxylesterase
MNTVKSRKARVIRPVLATCFALAVALGACGWFGDPPPEKTATIRLDAFEPVHGQWESGDFQGVGDSQKIKGVATDRDGKPLGNTKVKLTVSGANSATNTLTTGGDGVFMYSYTGAHAGDDAITGAVDGAKTASTRVVVRWLNRSQSIHPIIFVHGTNEDAADFTTQIRANTTLPESSKETLSALFSALKMKYDTRFMEAFCFVDDRAYDHDGAPSGCRYPADRATYSSACVPQINHVPSGYPCQSQSKVDENARQLALTIKALSDEARAAGAKKTTVTLIAYSMGGAVIRSLFAGCPLYAKRCSDVSGLIDQVFFLDADQQGSWLLTINEGINAATLRGEPGDTSIPNPITPFSSVLSIVQQAVFDKLKTEMGLDGTSQAVRDQTPRSDSIVAHDKKDLPAGIPYYSFFGDIQIRLRVNTYGLPLSPSSPTLHLGDLVMLAQDDHATVAPMWGGAGLCEGCPKPLDKYRKSPSGQYHNWVLADPHDLDMSFVADLLNGSTNVSSEAGKLINSPLQHLNIMQPLVQSPGSTWQVNDITHPGATTDMSTEIFYILAQSDANNGVTLP